MKKNMILRLCIAVTVAAIFVGCSIYETEHIEIRRCPRVQDTVRIIDWNDVDINVDGL